MPIATSLVAALFASPTFAAGAAAPVATTYAAVPPMIVNVSSAPNVSGSLVSRLLAETDAIWRGTGFTFVWRRATCEGVPCARTSEAIPSLASTLRVVIGNETVPSRDGTVPLGWIRFEDGKTPQQEIYLSYASVGKLLAVARDVVGQVDHMTLNQRETLSARALGRALAHELGHYLLASKTHTKDGLMKASRTAAELFALEGRGFQVEPSQHQVMAARLRREALIVRR